jgi:heme A synthase
MASMAISVLWFLIGLIVLAGVIYLAIWVIESFIYPIPDQVKKGVWVIVLLLALIALISVLVGGGNVMAPFRLGK